MNTKQIATLRTGPPGLFSFNEMSYAEFPDAIEIIYHAHAIPGSIALIQVGQAGTGKAGATEAVLDATFHDLVTVLNPACHAGFRFMSVVTPASRTGLLISPVSTAELAVHAARGDQRAVHRLGL